VTFNAGNVLFYAYMPMLLCDCQSFIKESYLLTYSDSSRRNPQSQNHDNALQCSATGKTQWSSTLYVQLQNVHKNTLTDTVIHWTSTNNASQDVNTSFTIVHIFESAQKTLLRPHHSLKMVEELIFFGNLFKKHNIHNLKLI